MDPHDLYGLPLEQFTPERNALAKQLRGQGRRDEAAAVGSLRKPSVAAWAVNQLARTQRREVKALFESGDAIRRAQSALLAGSGDAAKLRDASERERAAVAALTDKARGLLSAEGRELTQATLDRVSDTLHAAALDDEARTEVKDACLVTELRHAGLGSGGAVAPRARAARRAAAKKAEADARRVAERAAHQLAVAEQRRDRAAKALRDAESSVDEAMQRARQATRDHERAQRELDRT